MAVKPLNMLSLGCQIKSFEFVQRAIQAGTLPDEETLTWACYSQNLEILSAVIKRGARPCPNTLLAACLTGRVEIVRMAIEQGAILTSKAFAEAKKDPAIFEEIQKIQTIFETSPSLSAYAEEEFLRLYELAREGDAISQFRIGLCYSVGDGVAQDHTQAALWFQKAADQGNAEAQFELGSCYEMGNGVEQDQEMACRWFQKAADQGSCDAKQSLKNL